MPKREMVTVDLVPVAGSRFQPTGFPDLGAGLFKRWHNGEWEECLLVESAQSMANHLEASAWDRGASAPVPAMAALPYVRVAGADGAFLASSRTEAHRLASAFVKDSVVDGVGMRAVIKDRLGLADDTPLAPRQIAAALFRLDPMCLVHGVFFAEPATVWPGQPKVARALTGFVEAHGVMPAVSGGVKRDEVRHQISEGAGGAAEGYGSVPFHRTEYVAKGIQTAFALDLDQLASYGLPAVAADLLAGAARFEIRSLLDRGLRLRTACDLVPADTSQVDAQLPPLDHLIADLDRLSRECAALWDDPPVLEVVWRPEAGKKKVKGA